MTRLFPLALLLCASCAPTLSGWGHSAAQGALAELSSDAGISAIAAARDVALGATTDAELQALVGDTAVTTRQQLDAAEHELQARLRDSLADALGPATEAHVGALREELVGAPLRADLDVLIAQETPKLAAAIAQSVQASLAPVRAEEAKWRTAAVGIAVGAGCLLVVVVFLAFERRRHHRELAALRASANPG